jgi:hypothetical protein
MNSPIFYASKFLMILGYSVSLYLRFMSAGIAKIQESEQDGQENDPKRSQFNTEELLPRDDTECELVGTANYVPNNMHTMGRQINSLLPGAILNLNLFGSI